MHLEGVMDDMQNRMAANSGSDSSELASLTGFVEHQVRSLVLDDHFPCVGARSAVKSGGYNFRLYSNLASPASIDQMGEDLTRFIADPPANKPFITFIAAFAQPRGITDESHWDALTWRALQFLHASDIEAWDSTVSSDPIAPDFSFSFGGRAFFVVGLHPASSRYARRFAWPTLVFNLHSQFEQLRSQGKFTRFQDTIRSRDLRLQGTINPNLSDFGDESDAGQYSGTPTGEDWRCPFTARATTPEKVA
jgi:FPC/CPF motif-containing protein YcgG